MSQLPHAALSYYQNSCCMSLMPRHCLGIMYSHCIVVPSSAELALQPFVLARCFPSEGGVTPRPLTLSPERTPRQVKEQTFTPSIKSDFFKLILWYCLLWQRRFFFYAGAVSARNRAESAEAINRQLEKVCFYRGSNRIIWEIA